MNRTIPALLCALPLLLACQRHDDLPKPSMSTSPPPTEPAPPGSADKSVPMPAPAPDAAPPADAGKDKGDTGK